MQKYVRVENDQVVECLDYLPGTPGDWREAIDITPTLIPLKQICGPHHFDISKNPVEIVWSVIDLNEQERKETLMNILVSPLTFKMQQEMQKEFNNSLEGIGMDVDFVRSLTEQVRAIKTEIAALTTHEEIDAYIAAKGITP
jgi:hypothetical protein